MVLLRHVMLCFCALAVAVNGQMTPLGITPSMTATASPGADYRLTMAMVTDLETPGTPSTCGATTPGRGASITVYMLQSYVVSRVTILNKESVKLQDSPTPETLTKTYLNGANSAPGTTVAVSATPTGGTQCTTVAPSTAFEPFVTSGSNIAATYVCGNIAGKYLIFTAPAASTAGLYICQLTVYQQDPTTPTPPTTTTSTTSTTMAPTTTKQGARFAHLNRSIIIVMLLAVITKLMIDNGRQ